MQQNQCVLGLRVAEALMAMAPKQRKELLRLLHHLVETCHEPADDLYMDEDSRWISVKLERGWRISYSLDGPVREVRIVGIQRLKP